MIEESRIEKEKRRGETEYQRQKRRKKEAKERESKEEAILRKKHAPFHKYDPEKYKFADYFIPTRTRNVRPEENRREDYFF